MIKYVKGDAFKAGCDVLIHGCNCFNNMGAGFALQVAEYYPEAYRVDIGTNRGDSKKLGTYTMARCRDIFTDNHDVTIINAYTQFYPRMHPPPFDYEAFEKVLVSLKPMFDHPALTIGAPKIGAGLAGGDWDRIAAIIEKVYPHRDIIVFEYEPKN